jgi:hypothetical protein
LLGPGVPQPSGKALRDLRRRLGAGLARRLFETLAGPLGRAGTPGVMFGGYRTVSFDGCKSVKAPDTPPNRGWLGKRKASNGEAGYPSGSDMADYQYERYGKAETATNPKTEAF